MDKNKYIKKGTTVTLLTKFVHNPNVYSILKQVAFSDQISDCYINDDSISVKWNYNDKRLIALEGLLKSESREVIEIIQKKKNNGYPCERYMILEMIDGLISQSTAREIYISFATDNHAAVRKKALGNLKKIKTTR